MAASNPQEYEALVEEFAHLAALEWRQSARDDAALRQTLGRYFRRGLAAGFSQGELIDFLGVSSPTVLQRAGYAEAEASRALALLTQITDEEMLRADAGAPLWSGSTLKLRSGTLMHASLLVQIVVRLFALLWAAYGLVGSLQAMSIYWASDFVSVSELTLLTVVQLLFGVLAWWAAPRLGRLVVGRRDAPVAVGGLAVGDLYAGIILFLGLYFALSAIAPVMVWLHYTFVTTARGYDLNPFAEGNSGYDLAQPILQMAAGVVCMFFSRRWGAALASREQRASASPASGGAAPESLR